MEKQLEEFFEKAIEYLKNWTAKKCGKDAVECLKRILLVCKTCAFWIELKDWTFMDWGDVSKILDDQMEAHRRVEEIWPFPKVDSRAEKVRFWSLGVTVERTVQLRLRERFDREIQLVMEFLVKQWEKDGHASHTNPAYDIWKLYMQCFPDSPDLERTLRMKIVQNCTWGILSPENIQQILAFCGDATILEIGAGFGYSARLLASAGATVVACDNISDGWDGELPSHYPVKNCCGVEMLKEMNGAPDCVLMLIWPRCTRKFLDAYKGQKIIYLGEGLGGAQGGDGLFEEYTDLLPCYTGTEHDTLNLAGSHTKLYLIEKV